MTRNPDMHRTGYAATLALLLVASSKGDEPAQPAARERAAHAARVKAVAASLHIYRTPDRKAEATVMPEPVLRYVDSTRQIHESTLWIWASEGRPVAVVAIEYYNDPPRGARWLYEIASLSTDRIAVQRGSETNWTAKEAGLRLEAITGAAPPADKPARRLTQMKDLLRRFSAHEHEGSEGRLELRPLASPLYRYEDAAQNVVDGAIFAFASGTNPEVLMVLEAHGGTEGPAVWKFAPAQMTGAAVVVELDGKEVWRRADADPPAMRASYMNGWIVDDAVKFQGRSRTRASIPAQALLVRPPALN
jgi:hypothetical protein